MLQWSMAYAGIRRFIALNLTLLLYTLPCQGELDGSRHAGSLPVRQDAYERHEIVLKSVIGRRRAPTMPLCQSQQRSRE
jgi:hypothetical protein